MVQLQLVDASTGKRAAAKLIDLALLALVQLVPFGLGAASLARVSGSRYPTAADEAALLAAVIWYALGAGLAMAGWVILWGWEARSGSSPGNAMLGLRTTGLEGHAPGWGAVFVRNLVFALICLIPLVGVVLALISNVFDANGQRQGWHDKAARTLVFDVRAGRNPVLTGGIDGPGSFAPQEPLPPVRPVASPVAAPVRGLASARAETHAPVDDLESTRLAAPAATGGDVVLSFSDGRRVALAGPVLVGRNPAAYDGETVQELVSVADPERSVSKTHLTVWTERGRVWVQDRKSTNGTHVVRQDGSGSPLDPGLPLEVSAGDVVHFGDYFFSVGISREARA